MVREKQLHELLAGLGRPMVCVVGDFMLDTYVWGRVSRVSPEGPIPVLLAVHREHRPGGAGSVASMLCALGAQVSCVGVAGQDEAGRELRRRLQAAGANTSGLVTCDGRPTTLKTRYLGYVQSAGRGQQQMLRVDEETVRPISAAQTKEVLAKVNRLAKDADVVLIQDMAKGLCSPKLLHAIIREAASRKTPVLVDPERGEDYTPYKGATCLVPNRFEAETAAGLPMDLPEQWSKAARRLLRKLSLKAVVIKLDRDGMFFATAGGEERHMPTRARDVTDVTGAGDMVAAVMAMAMAADAPLEQGIELANFAAGIEVTRHGAAAISRAELLEEIEGETDPAKRKIKTRHQLSEILAERRARGQKIVFTNGCFDLLHLGHVELIRHARRQGDCLVVGVNSDRSARQLKGPGRPINSQDVRARTLASLSDVDYVVVFDEVSVLPLIRDVRPDVLVKGGDYDKKGVVGWEFVESYGGQVKLAPQVRGLSTTELIRKISGKDEGKDRKGS